MEREYKILNQQIFESGDYKLVPIRYEDRYDIMKWRNEQIYHLRQVEPLTEEMQDRYFEIVVANLFRLERPDQILFSYLHHNHCIGYGGLVHINWVDKNAEVSFIMDTKLEKNNFVLNWHSYTELIEQVAFEELNFQKLYIYAFDLRPHLYDTLEACDYFFDARLTSHCLFQDEFKDVIIYSKLRGK